MPKCVTPTSGSCQHVISCGQCRMGDGLMGYDNRSLKNSKLHSFNGTPSYAWVSWWWTTNPYLSAGLPGRWEVN